MGSWQGPWGSWWGLGGDFGGSQQGPWGVPVGALGVPPPCRICTARPAGAEPRRPHSTTTAPSPPPRSRRPSRGASSARPTGWAVSGGPAQELLQLGGGNMVCERFNAGGGGGAWGLGQPPLWCRPGGHEHHPVSPRRAGEVTSLEGLTVVYRSSVDLFFYVVGGSQENEVGGGGQPLGPPMAPLTPPALTSPAADAVGRARLPPRHPRPPLAVSPQGHPALNPCASGGETEAGGSCHPR